MDVKVYLDPDDETVIQCFTDEKNKLCRYIVLKDKISIHLAAYYALIADLNRSKDAFLKVKEFPENERMDNISYDALIDFAIMRLMKCFVQADGRKIKLEEKIVFNNEDEKFKIFSQLKNIRHQDIAHAGNFELNNLVLYFSSQTELGFGIHFHICRMGRRPSSLNDNIDEVILLIDHISDFVDVKMKKIVNRLSNEVREKGFDYYHKNSKRPNTKELYNIPMINFPSLPKNWKVVVDG